MGFLSVIGKIQSTVYWDGTRISVKTKIIRDIFNLYLQIIKQLSNTNYDPTFWLDEILDYLYLFDCNQDDGKIMVV